MKYSLQVKHDLPALTQKRARTPDDDPHPLAMPLPVPIAPPPTETPTVDILSIDQGHQT